MLSDKREASLRSEILHVIAREWAGTCLAQLLEEVESVGRRMGVRSQDLREILCNVLAEEFQALKALKPGVKVKTESRFDFDELGFFAIPEALAHKIRIGQVTYEQTKSMAKSDVRAAFSIILGESHGNTRELASLLGINPANKKDSNKFRAALSRMGLSRKSFKHGYPPASGWGKE